MFLGTLSIEVNSYYLILKQNLYRNEELRGLAVNPINDSEFATAGDDSKVIVWNMDKRRSVRKK